MAQLLLLACVGAELAGPSQVDTYRLAEIRLEGATESTQAIWDVRPAGCDFQEQGHKLVLTGKPGDYEVEAIVVDFDARTLQRLRHNVVIGKPGPGPKPPEPDPDPEPGPKPPPELSELSKKVAEWANGYPVADRKALAAAHRNSANAISSSMSPEDAEKVAEQNNRAAVGERRLEWLPFFRQLQTELRTNWQAKGKWQNGADCAKAFREIAAGLEAGL